MVHPKGCGHLGQTTPDTILECPDCPFYLPVDLTVANGDVVMDGNKPFAKLCKAVHKLTAIFGLDIVQLAPMGNQVVI